eukprot:comp23361_c0_seq1/m.38597 comp23361_c0_seq1/g.38597  ORF comp23361_c0_seq1/g.38597 comp23361_c0_seq1/m.38597 type:complete len:337 (-) comp23361_c0_seq1:169-1179(-)
MDFDFFALSTEVGKLVEEATSEQLMAEDWEKNLNITDVINATDNGPTDAIRAIKKRLSNKNQKVVLLTLTVLETCVKNCGLRFQELTGRKDFMDRFVTVASQKNSCGERARIMLAEWVDAFKSIPGVDFSPMLAAYEALRKEGHVFPAVDSTKSAPINLPDVVPPEPQGQPPAAAAQDGGKIKPTDKEVAKLRGDLGVVKGNIEVLNEMVGALQAGERPDALLQEVYTTTKAMQVRVVSLIDQLDHDGLIGELLDINDKLVAAFDKYDVATQQQAQATGGDAPLVDISDDTEPPTDKMAALDIKKDQHGPSLTPTSSSTHDPVSSEDFDNFLSSKL